MFHRNEWSFVSSTILKDLVIKFNHILGGIFCGVTCPALVVKANVGRIIAAPV